MCSRGIALHDLDRETARRTAVPSPVVGPFEPVDSLETTDLVDTVVDGLAADPGPLSLRGGCAVAVTQ